MKYLRHSPLALWLLVCGAMIAVIVSALLVQGSHSTAPHSLYTAHDRNVVMALRSDMVDLHVAATPPATTLAAWATKTATIVDAAAKDRLVRSDKEDRLYQSYMAMAGDARSLAGVDTSNVLAVQTGVSLVEADADTLTQIVSGSAPAFVPLPGESLAPSTGPAGSYILPVSPAPGVSAVPFNPAQPAQPALPGVPTGGSQ